MVPRVILPSKGRNKGWGWMEAQHTRGELPRAVEVGRLLRLPTMVMGKKDVEIMTATAIGIAEGRAETEAGVGAAGEIVMIASVVGMTETIVGTMAGAVVVTIGEAAIGTEAAIDVVEAEEGEEGGAKTQIMWKLAHNAQCSGDSVQLIEFS